MFFSGKIENLIQSRFANVKTYYHNLLPNKERLIAKLDDTKDLPSPLMVEVTRITFLPFSSIN